MSDLAVLTLAALFFGAIAGWEMYDCWKLRRDHRRFMGEWNRRRRG